jgi:hypothetical protein
LESTAETQPQLQPALLRLLAMISQYFTAIHDFTRETEPCGPASGESARSATHRSNGLRSAPRLFSLKSIGIFLRP